MCDQLIERGVHASRLARRDDEELTVRTQQEQTQTFSGIANPHYATTCTMTLADVLMTNEGLKCNKNRTERKSEPQSYRKRETNGNQHHREVIYMLKCHINFLWITIILFMGCQHILGLDEYHAAKKDTGDTEKSTC